MFIHLLSENIIRFHYKFDKDYSINKPNEFLDLDNFTNNFDVKQFDLSIKTSELTIEIHPCPFEIKVYNKEGMLISADESELGFWSEALDYNKTQNEIRCYKRYGKQAPCIFGLGDKTGSINRWGQRFRNAPIDALGYDSKSTDPLYKDIPFFIHLDTNSQLAHGIFFDNFYAKFFDFGRERKPSPYYYFGAESGDLNYYLIYGPSIKKIVSRYLELTGRPPEWPEFTYGYLASGMAYTENPQTQCDNSLLTSFKRLESNSCKPSAFHLSSGYIQNSQGERQQFVWNADKFPDPQQFSTLAKELGIELTANVKPVLLCSHPWYQEANDLKLFINDFKNKTLVVDYWGGRGSYLDFTKKQTQFWWKEKLQTNILANGIRGIWNDNNEYEIFEPHKAHGQLPKMSLIMSKLALEAGSDWVLSRSGYAGIQRYAQTWIGDNCSSWQSLQYDNAILSSMSISGLIHCGTDIGGFWGDGLNSELLLRWIQNGVFTPRFCIHSYKDTPTEPDMFAASHPEHFKIIQKFMALRNEFIPYIKETARKASQEGIPIMRPTVYDFQDDTNTYNQSFEYMFGDKYLVAPIYKPMAESTIREIYLPGKNTTWTHYFTGEKFQGGQTISLFIDINTIPVFIKG